MEQGRAKELLHTERLHVEHLLAEVEEMGGDDRTAANQPGEMLTSPSP